MALVIALANHKGGTAKTTTCASLGVALLELGYHPILLVDCDPTGALSASFGVFPTPEEKTIYHAMLERGTSLKRVTRSLRNGLDLAPASRDLSAAELLLPQEAAGDVMLRQTLQPVREVYPFILLDCPPNLGPLTINALTAADGVLIPLTPAYLSLNPLQQLFDTIEAVRTRLNPTLQLWGLLLTQFNRNTLHAQEVEERLRALYPALLLPQVIGQSVRFQEAPAGAQTILDYQPSHPGARAYRDVAKEVIRRAQAHSTPLGRSAARRGQSPKSR
jgi:chromosome partitioning protein